MKLYLLFWQEGVSISYILMCSFNLFRSWLRLISGTITPVLTFLIYELALSSSHVQKIREELQMVENIGSDHQLRKLPHLNAVIHETMRVHPPVLDGLPRDTPAEGVTIDGRFIPGNVTCLAPFSTISKRKSCFRFPECFNCKRIIIHAFSSAQTNEDICSRDIFRRAWAFHTRTLDNGTTTDDE